MKLYNYFRSSASFRVRIALEIKRLPYEYLPVHLGKGEHREASFLAISPSGLVPALKIDSGAVLSQSLAILEYLDEAHPSPALLPADALGRARVRALAGLIACEIHPVNNLRVLKYLENILHVTEDQKLAWYRHWVRDGQEAFERDMQLMHRARYDCD